MKKSLRLFLFAVFFLPLALNAQLSAIYQFSTGIDTTKWYTLTSDSTLLKVGTGNDSYASPVLNIGFTFNFAGVDYTQFSVNSDGTVRLGSTAVLTSYYTTPFGPTNANFNSPKICALGCDGYLAAATDNTPADYIAYQLFEDSEGDHVLVIEISTGTYANATRNNHYTFQIQLAEADNSVTLAYSPTAPAAGPAVTYQLGACVNANDIVLFNVANNTMSVYNHGTSDYNAAGTWPDAGRYYTITPDPYACYPVTSLTASNVTSTSITLTWADTNNLGASYTLYNGDIEVISNLYDTTYTFTGLSPNTDYDFHVISHCSSVNISNPANINVHTSCGATNLPWTCSFEENEIVSTTAATALPWCTQRYVSAGTLGTTFPYSYFGSTYAHTGTRSLYFYGSTNSSYPDTAAIILPEVDVNVYPMNNNRVTFWGKTNSADNSKVVHVGTLTNPSDFSTFTLIESVTVSGNIHNMYSVPLANATSSHIALVVFKSTGNLYIDDVTIEEMPSCAEITGLTVTDITTSSISLSWVDAQNSEGTTYTVYNMADTSVALENITGNVAVIGNLDANTLYTFGVESNCASGDAPLIFITERTACTPFPAPHTWTFEDMPASEDPLCWTKIGSGTVNVLSNTSNSHNGSMYVRFNGSTSNLIALPETQAEITTLQLRFWTRPESYTNANCGNFSVGYITDITDESSFVEVANYVYSDFSSYEEQTVTFAGAPAGSRMAMRHNPVTTSWYWYIDDVTIEEAPDCLPISALNAINVTTNSATLTWGGVASSYNIYDMSDSSLVATVNTTSYNLTGLTAITNYIYGVTANCTDGESPMVILSFNTACNAVVLPYTETFETNSETLECWSNEGDGNWTFGVGDYSSTTGSFEGSQNAKITHFITGNVTKFISPVLDGAPSGLVLYFAYVMRSWGNSVDELRVYSRAAADSAWQLAAEYTAVAPTWTTTMIIIPSPVYQVAFEYTDNYGYGVGIDSVVFTALSSNYCFDISNLQVSGATDNSVSLSWNDEYNNGASYTIYNMADNSVVASGVTTTNYEITGLATLTDYTFGVVANCSATDESNVVTVEAATLCGGESCNITIVGHDSYGDGWNDNAINIIQNGIIISTFTLANDSLLVENFAVCDEAPVSFSWVAGSFTNETSFEIIDGANISVYTGVGSNMTSGIFFTLDNACAPVIPVDTLHVTLSINDVNLGSITPAVGHYDLVLYDTLLLTATPNAGANFEGWRMIVGGQTIGTLPLNPYPLVVNPNLITVGQLTVLAIFSDSTSVPDSLTVILNTADATMGTTDPAPGTHSYAVGEQSVISAVPNPGYIFLYWVESATISGMTLTDTLYASTISLNVTPLYANMTLNLTAYFEAAPADPCEAPTGLTSGAITHESIAISWDANADVNSWNIQYRPVGGTLSSANATTNSYTITGLAPETQYEIQVQAVCSDGQTSDWSASVTATTLTGINDLLLSNIVLFPNPAKDVVNVQYTMNNVQVKAIEVFDVYGKLLQTVSMTPETTTINVSGLASGMYFVRMTTEEGIVTKSFVKK